MQIGIPLETRAGEARVAATPETVKKYVAQGHQVLVQSGAGVRASCPDAAYEAAGASIVDAARAFGAELVLKVRAPDPQELTQIRPGAALVGMLDPFDADNNARMAAAGIVAFALEAAPRTTRAQSMDVLSSQANIAGYKAVLVAANHYQRFMPMLMTAAGTVKAARVLILGAGVAGLQAIATAKRLGAVVEVSDIRAEVKEQVESLGAKFIDLPDMQSGEESGGYAKQVTPEFLAKQQSIVAERVRVADVVITTALVPGRPAPKLVTEDMVKAMRPGSVIVDLAVSQGGNCELSELDQEVVKHGVRIIGHSNLPATLPEDASMLYARNVQELLLLLVKEGRIELDLEDDVIAGTVLTHRGEIRNERVAEAVRSAA